MGLNLLTVKIIIIIDYSDDSFCFYDIVFYYILTHFLKLLSVMCSDCFVKKIVQNQKIVNLYFTQIYTNLTKDAT